MDKTPAADLTLHHRSMDWRVKFSWANRKMQTSAVFTAKWVVTSSCVSCGQWRPHVRLRAGQGQEQPSSDPGRGRNLCEDQPGGEAEGTSGGVQPRRDFFIKAIWLWLLTRLDATACLPACLLSIYSSEQFSSSEKLSAGAGRDPRKNTQQDKNSQLRGKRKTRTTFAMVIGYLRDMEGSKKSYKVCCCSPLVHTVVLFCSVCKKCQLFPCHVPFCVCNSFVKQSVKPPAKVSAIDIYFL